MIQRSAGSRIFQAANMVVLLLLAAVCLAPLLHVLAVSFSSSGPASSGAVGLWPVGFTLKSYQFIFEKPQFLRAMGVSARRVLLAVPVQMTMTLLVAYPLSRNPLTFKSRSVYVWVFLITMLFSGGLIPSYMVVSKTGLLDSIWAMILPGAVPVFNVILLLNFFRELPEELADAAFIDGAGHWRILWQIYVPLSTPAIATLVLFVIVNHWNAWFDGILYISNPANYPLQSYLRGLVVDITGKQLTRADINRLAYVSERTAKCAQIFVGAVPVLLVYPFLQRYFTKGLVLGSVKG